MLFHKNIQCIHFEIGSLLSTVYCLLSNANPAYGHGGLPMVPVNEMTKCENINVPPKICKIFSKCRAWG